MIVSAIDGRIRYVDPILQNDTMADGIESSLEKIYGVSRVEVNRIVGSLLVQYAGNDTCRRSILKTLKYQIKKNRGRKKKSLLNGRQARRYIKYIMAGTITGSMAALFAGSERWHYRIGTVFLSAFSLHLYQNKKTFFK